MSSSHIIFIPGDVTIDPLEAIKKSLARFPRPIAKTQQLGKQYAQRFRQRAGEMYLPSKRMAVSPAHPVQRTKHKIIEMPNQKARRLRREMLDAGASLYGLLKAEGRYLPRILHDGEHIEAVIYGQHQSSSAMLLATSERILYLDKKPMVVMSDEVSYEVISGIEFDVHTLFCTVVLHTPVRNYDFRFVNLRCGEKFARYIESQRLEKEEPETARPVIDQLPQTPGVPTIKGRLNELKEDMAGYYWLPSDEEERRKAGLILT